MYEKDKKKGGKRRIGRRLRTCARGGSSGGKEKREISIRISRRREKAYLLVHVLYYIFICIIFFLLFLT